MPYTPSALVAPKALVTGATGLLGRQVIAAFTRAGWSVTGTGFSRVHSEGPRLFRLDLNDEDAISEVLSEELPNIVIHCAAQRFPDKVSADPTAARVLNVDSTKTLAKLCLSYKTPLLYISTDYVFSGRAGEAPYTSSSPTDPPNTYGQLKRDGELAVLETLSPSGLAIILRIPVLYGTVDPVIGNPESSINTLRDTVWVAQSSGTEMEVDDWAIRYPTNTEDVARVIVDISKKWIYGTEEETKGWEKILQFSAEEAMTKYQVCEVLAGVLGYGVGGLKRDKDGGGGGGPSRPYDTKLDTRALKDLGISTRAMKFEDWWKRELKAYRK